MLHTFPRQLTLAAITLSAIAAMPVTAQTRNEDFKLLPTNGAEDDFFGFSVAISGTMAVVGAYGNASGSAYLFDTITGMQIAKLAPTDGSEGDYFGYSVAISGTTSVIGAYGDDDNGTASGSAYLFDTITGQQIAKLLPSDGTTGDRFGVSVSISGATAVVGAYLDEDNGTASGSAYHFDATSPCLADTNHDGQLSPTDFTAWIAAFNRMAPECDQNSDGLCTPADFTAWIANYNAGCN